MCSPPPSPRPPDKAAVCSNTHGRAGSDSPDPDCGGRVSRDPLRVFPRPMCGPAEVTGRTCLLVERLAEKRDGKRGNLRESYR